MHFPWFSNISSESQKYFQEGDDSDVVISFEFETLKFPAKIGIKSRYQVSIWASAIAIWDADSNDVFRPTGSISTAANLLRVAKF